MTVAVAIPNAFISTGQTLNLTAVDLTDLDVIGWEWGRFPSSGFTVGAAQARFRSVILVEPVPEPSTLAIFGVGLLGVGMAARRRR